MYLVTADEMREMDRQTIKTFGLPGRILMENAGRGTADVFMRRFSGHRNIDVGVAAGPGNNGGDGFVIARYLAQKGIPVTAYLLANNERVRGDAAVNRDLLTALNITLHEIPDEPALSKHKQPMGRHTVWIDAIFGTGLTSEITGHYRKLIQYINDSGKPVLAVDIPSGLHSDTGQPCGTCISADTTVTFAFAKVGHFLYPGAALTGRLEIIDIGIPPHIAGQVNPRQHLISAGTICKKWGKRAPDAHKGATGHLLVIAGSPGKTGAAAMTAMAAMRSGAGLVTLGLPESINTAVESHILEVMTAPLPESADGFLDETAFKAAVSLMPDKKCIALGPGLGAQPGTKRLIGRLLVESKCPIVIDADGLNNLAGQTEILKTIDVPVVVTPHPGEMARLTGSRTGDIQKDRVSAARSFASAHGVYVVLKGAGTVVAHPDGEVFINPTGNSGMASGGMGDVLTGLIAGLITQGHPLPSAIHAGVYLHGSTADRLSMTRGPVGFLAGDVIGGIPEEMHRLFDKGV